MQRHRITCLLTALVMTSPVAGGVTAAADELRTTAAAEPPVEVAYDAMSPGQRIGQLLMGAVTPKQLAAGPMLVLTRRHVGNVVLIGHFRAGVRQTAASLVPVRSATTYAGVGPLVAVDQEGGYVQHLTGSGFSTIPTALRQGRDEPSVLRRRWTSWAGELRRAGVNLDLAPVADVVPASIGRMNQPIGRYDREYGHSVGRVARHVAAAERGMRDAGLGASLKHFPGLGRATANTDTDAGVTDPTASDDAYLDSFRAAVDAGAPAAMVSTAIYPNIDPGVVGAFSRRIVTTLLRGRLGFTGLVLTDSLTAESVTGFTYAARAIRSLTAGADVLLVTSNAAITPMTRAIRRRCTSDPAFAKLVRAAVMRVLRTKNRLGLIR